MELSPRHSEGGAELEPSEKQHLLLAGPPVAGSNGVDEPASTASQYIDAGSLHSGGTSGSAGGSADGSAGGRSQLQGLLSAFWQNGVLVAIASSFFFATAAALVKTPLIQGRIPVFEIVVVRALVSGLVTSLSCRAGGIPIFGRTAPQLLLSARGIIGASAMTASYEALVRLPLADSTVIFYCSPALTALLAWLLLGEAFTWLMAAGCVASLAGVLLVAQPPWLVGGAALEWTRQRLLGTLFGFAGAALAAGAYICIRLIGRREHPLTVAMYFHLAALFTSIGPLAVGYPEPAVLPSPAQAALLLGIACGSFGGNLMVNRAFQLEAAAKASAVNFVQVIFAYMIGTIFYRDPLTLLGLAGTALIAAGVIVVNLEKLMKACKSEAGAAAAAPGSGGGVVGGGGGGSAPPPADGAVEATAGGGRRWWQRPWLLGRQLSEVQLKSKRSDLEAEMGQLPPGQFKYQQLNGGNQR